MPFDFEDELDETLYENFYADLYGDKDEVQSSSKRIKELMQEKGLTREDDNGHSEKT